MILPDHQIERRCTASWWRYPLIVPFKQEHLQPASVDLTLADLFIVPTYANSTTPIDLKDLKGSDIKQCELVADSFTLMPLHFVLSSTVEKVQIPPGLVGRVEGKSSLGRLGLSVHSTAGYLDPGFKGTITLEMFNANPRPLQMWSGQPICQVAFQELSAPARHPYGSTKLNSKYQGQTATTASRYQG